MGTLDQPDQPEGARAAAHDGPSITSRALALNPSVGALSFQAATVVAHLERFTSQRFPNETIRLAGVLRTIADRVLDCIDTDPFPSAEEMTIFQIARFQSLARIVQKLNSYIRFLQSSDPFTSPPGIQRAISSLIAKVTPHVLNTTPDEVVVLVRPQWTYNLKFINLLELMEPFRTDLDRFDETGAADLRELLRCLWKNNGPDSVYGSQPPKYASILSFAGLDYEDVLLYPLLVHEIGHFLDLSQETPIYANQKLRTELSFPSLTT